MTAAVDLAAVRAALLPVATPGDLRSAVRARRGSRSGWTVNRARRPVATRTADDGWSATIRTVHDPVKAQTRWHIAIRDPRGIAARTCLVGTPAEAVRRADDLLDTWRP